MTRLAPPNPMAEEDRFTATEIARDLQDLAGQMERVANRMSRPDQNSQDLIKPLARHASEMRAAATIARGWAENLTEESQ